jgi:hypothetical protein
MLRNILLLFFCSLLTLLTRPLFAQIFRISCIGSNATYGETMANRSKNNYPAQLQYLLGNSYKVQNFGLTEAFVYSKGENSYINSSKCKEALSFEPDLVMFEFGSVESKAIFRAHLSNFKKEYTELIKLKKPSKRMEVKYMSFISQA